MSYKFTYLDKQYTEEILPDLFEILHSNMSVISPTGNTYEEDFALWSSCVAPAMQKENRQIILMYSGDALAGYFQYYTNSDSLMMEEIQIKEEYQGTGLFNTFYSWLVVKLPEDIKYVEAYANKKNVKSQGILEHMGLVKSGENKNGNSFYYKGDYTQLLKKYR